MLGGGAATRDLNEYKPRLVSLVRVDNGDLADASLSPSPKERLQKLVTAGSIPRKKKVFVKLQPQSLEELQRWSHSANSQARV
ncbi:MAG: hypothetical protein Q9171_002728 [Xanthocarpia ochracea]